MAGGSRFTCADLFSLNELKLEPETSSVFENMLKQVDYFIGIDNIAGTCKQLEAVYKKTDGVENPPDFITGDSPEIDNLIMMIQDLMNILECK